MATTIAYTLSVPIKAHGEELQVLDVRRPTTQEVRAIKTLPYKIDKSEDVSLDMDAVCKYVAVCATIPQSSVEQLDLSDLNGLAWMIAGFFMTPASSPQTS